MSSKSKDKGSSDNFIKPSLRYSLEPDYDYELARENSLPVLSNFRLIDTNDMERKHDSNSDKIGDSQKSKQFPDRVNENRSPNLTNEPFDSIDNSYDRIKLFSNPHVLQGLRSPTIVPRNNVESPEMALPGSFDFLLFTDEKPLHSKAISSTGIQDDDFYGWKHEPDVQGTLNLDGAFKAAADARYERYDILDTASKFSDIQAPVANSYDSDANSQFGLSQAHLASPFVPQNDTHQMFNYHDSTQVPGLNDMSRNINPVRNSREFQRSGNLLQPRPHSHDNNPLQSSWDSGRHAAHDLTNDVNRLGISEVNGDDGYYRNRNHHQQQYLLPSHYHQQQHQQLNFRNDRGGSGDFRPNIDLNFEPRVSGGRLSHQQRGGVGSMSVDSNRMNSKMVHPGKSRQVDSSRQQYSLQSSFDSDSGGGNNRSVFHSLDASSSAFYPSAHRHQQQQQQPQQQNSKMSASKEFGKPVPQNSVSVSLTGSCRQELVETPRSKAAFKEFCRQFRVKEKISVDAARAYAKEALRSACDSIHWKIYMEMADLCRRHHIIQEARMCFALACQAQPRAVTGFLEWSKMEEDCGRFTQALNILFLGLKVTPAHELLISRAIKLQERLHNYSDVRHILGASLCEEPLDRVWKSVLEGALFEARMGNLTVARHLFTFLMHHVPWYGPIYFDAFRLEEKEQCDFPALTIITTGLNELPRYGPLWFGLLRIMERQDILAEQDAWARGERPQLRHLGIEAAEAIRQISRELTWKVHFEKAQAEERAAVMAANGLHNCNPGLSLKECRHMLLGDARSSLVRSLLSCPDNLRWKVLLAGSRLELSVGAIDKAKLLLRKAFAEVPSKSRANVYLECSRLEEFVGHGDVARQILRRARTDARSEWKVFMETILLEARAGQCDTAIQAAKESVDVHPGTGRLWAIYIQLLNRKMCEASNARCDVNIKQQRQLEVKKVIYAAIVEVPKSGEVWCERGRGLLNPLSMECFDLTEAQRSFGLAALFTPQYGDTFIEYARLEMICQVLVPQILRLLQLPVMSFMVQHLKEDLDSDLVDRVLQFGESQLQEVDELWQYKGSETENRLQRRSLIKAMLTLDYDFGHSVHNYANVTLKSLCRRCVNADPNYGTAWFECREQPYDPPSAIINAAIRTTAQDVLRSERVYARAVLQFICRVIDDESPVINSVSSVNDDDDYVLRDGKDVRLQKIIDSLNVQQLEDEKDLTNDVSVAQQRVKTLKEDMSRVQTLLDSSSNDSIGSVVDDSPTLNPLDFVTGLIDMNHTIFCTHLSEEVRRKYLFGSDQIIS